MLPKKRNSKWIVVYLAYAAIVFAGLLATRLILKTVIDDRLVIALALLSFGSALLPSLAGFFGKSMFFKIYVGCNLFALTYMFVLITSGRAPGWADLTSIVVYVYLLPVAVVLGILAEVIFYFKKKKNDNE